MNSTRFSRLFDFPSLLMLFILMILMILTACRVDFSPDELIPLFTPYEKQGGTDYLEIMVYGDAGRGNEKQKSTALAMSQLAEDPDSDFSFIINLGDSFYYDGVESVDDPMWETHFEDIYDQDVLTMPFFSVLGNHDYKGNIQAQLEYRSPYGDRWQMPDRYYSVTETLDDGTRIEFYFLDTERLFYGDTGQLDWLKDNLEASTARWIVAAGHKPLFSNGEHGSNGALITRLKPLFDDTVDLYVCGHEHDLQILKPVNGVHYVIDGAASSDDDTQVKDNTVFAASRVGFMTFLFSRDVLVCNVIESGAGLLYSQVLKEK
ncbi:MAG: metallophosphoesterase [Spirochaetales bacterium]|nr:metallophosphoesterase [Spirochaetales bacterium]